VYVHTYYTLHASGDLTRNVGMLRNSVLCNFAPALPVGFGLVLLLLKTLAEILLVPVVSRQNWGQVFLGEVTCYPACFSSYVLHSHFHLPEH